MLFFSCKLKIEMGGGTRWDPKFSCTWLLGGRVMVMVVFLFIWFLFSLFSCCCYMLLSSSSIPLIQKATATETATATRATGAFSTMIAFTVTMMVIAGENRHKNHKSRQPHEPQKPEKHRQAAKAAELPREPQNHFKNSWPKKTKTSKQCSCFVRKLMSHR